MAFFPDSDVERFMDKIEISETGCWNWTRHLLDGYGCFSLKGAAVSAHRFSYRCFVGPIPSGLQIDHLCRNRRCCNPEHLEAVTMHENKRRQRGCKDNWRDMLQMSREELEGKLTGW